MIEIKHMRPENHKIIVDLFINNTSVVLWFDFPEQVEKYISLETVDGVVVMLLYYALKHGYDIKSNIPMSAKLKYQINCYVIPILVKYSQGKLKTIKLDIPTLVFLGSEERFGATGISGGVDSFFSIYEHNYLHNDFPRIKILTYFNHGSLNGSYEFSNDKIRKVFNTTSEKNREFADNEGFDFLKVDSNLYEIIDTKFGWDHTFRTSGIVLLFQNGINNYYYARGVDISEFRINIDGDSAYMDLFLLPMFSTERVTFYSQGLSYTRNDKIKLLTNYLPTRKYLQVCVSDTSNCSRCTKCRRTMITLYALDKLAEYKNVFNIDVFKKEKISIFSDMLYLCLIKHDSFAKDNYRLLKENGKRISFASYLFLPLLIIVQFVRTHTPYKLKVIVKTLIHK